MKVKLFLLLLLLSTAQILHSQSIRITNPQPLKTTRINGYDVIQNYLQPVYFILNETDTILCRIINLDTEEFESKVSYSSTSLSQVANLIKVELFMTCCLTSMETFYFMIDFNGKLFEFPPIQNISYDGCNPKYDLIMPENFHGIKNKIYLGQINYDKDCSRSVVIPICNIPIKSFTEVKIKNR